MIVAAPIILLLLFATGINFAGRTRLSPGTTWLVTAASVLLVWISIILLRIDLPTGLMIRNWTPFAVEQNLLLFNLNPRTWVFAFSMVTLLTAVIFTDTIRLGTGNSLITWSGSMLLTAMGLLSIYAQTFLGIILTWMFIDVVEMVILLRITNHEKIHYAVFIEFITRIFGTGLIIAALVLSGNHAAVTDLSSIQQNVYLMLILGAFLRLGVLPLHVPLTANLPIRRSLGTMLRFVAPISVFSFLSQIPPQPQFQVINQVFTTVSLIVALYGSLRWAVEKTELAGRPYWMLAFSGLAMASFLNGQINSLTSLCVIMIVSGGFAFLHSRNSKVSLSLGILCLASVSGFPFFPTESVWSLGEGLQKGLFSILYIGSLTLLFFGFIKNLMRSRESKSAPERWMKLFYFSGLFFVGAAPWFLLIWRPEGGRIATSWVMPALCMGTAALLFFLRSRGFIKNIIHRKSLLNIITPLTLVWKGVAAIFRFEWFFTLLKIFFNIVSQPLKFFVRLLEGEGGLFWSFLFLAVISSIIMIEIMP